nr:hypothetical protein [Sinorhizobium meliloti]
MNRLFPGLADKLIDVQVLYAACRSATKAAGLTKRGQRARAAAQPSHPSAREWRHIRVVQVLLGHTHSSGTAR